MIWHCLGDWTWLEASWGDPYEGPQQVNLTKGKTPGIEAE